MKEIKIAIATVAILIVISLVNSSGFSTPFVQATSNDGNSEQATSNDGNDAIPFEGELLPQLSPSNEKVMQFEDTPTETISQSDNLQNPSIQNQVNQTPTLSQNDLQLQKQKSGQTDIRVPGKSNHDWELPNGKGCAWNDPLPGWPYHWICDDLETKFPWDEYNKTHGGGNTKPENAEPLKQFTQFGEPK